MITKLRGAHPWAMVLLQASDRSAPDWFTRDLGTDFLARPGNGGLEDWWSDISRTEVRLLGSAVFGWYRVNQTAAQLNALERYELAALARETARAMGDPIDRFSHVIALATDYGNTGAQGDVAARADSKSGQPYWRWCKNCEGLHFWNGGRVPGACAAGGQHDASPGFYVVATSAFAGGDQSWAWCNRCEGLIHDTGRTAPCPSQGVHDLGPANYALRRGPGPNEQSGWRHCRNCHALAFFDPSRGPGRCPAPAGHHDFTADDYSVAPVTTLSTGWFAHETGHGYGLVHSYGPSRNGDVDNDRRPAPTAIGPTS